MHFISAGLVPSDIDVMTVVTSSVKSLANGQAQMAVANLNKFLSTAFEYPDGNTTRPFFFPNSTVASNSSTHPCCVSVFNSWQVFVPFNAEGALGFNQWARCLCCALVSGAMFCRIVSVELLLRLLSSVI